VTILKNRNNKGKKVNRTKRRIRIKNHQIKDQKNRKRRRRRKNLKSKLN